MLGSLLGLRVTMGDQNLRHGSLALHVRGHSVTYRELLYPARIYAAARFPGIRRIRRKQSHRVPTRTTLLIQVSLKLIVAQALLITLGER